MTSKSSIDRQLDRTGGSIGYLSGQWVPRQAMSISIEDIGFRQGVTIVERLRTYASKLFAVEAHLERWQRSAHELGIEKLPSANQMRSLLDELLDRNAAAIEGHPDVGVTLFATPGKVGEEPTLGLHLNELNHSLIQRRRQAGQTLVVTTVRQPAGDCWPRTIKVRSRIHYFRADSIARRYEDDASGLLIDDDDRVTETSIANVAIVNAGAIVSPPPASVLPGVTQAVVKSLAAELRIPWTHQVISVSDLLAAEEVLLMGTDAGIWFASQVAIADQEGAKLMAGKKAAGPVFLTLRGAFDRFTAG
ncbi:MAG: aminotransferase class IV [Rubripirellula sp.]